MVIHVIVKKRQVRRNTFNSIISCIQSLINGFGFVKIYHVKRDLNSLVDQMAKIGITLEQGWGGGRGGGGRGYIF
jgi:hypothetical protein